MSKISFEIVQALRNTATALENSNHYQWGHMGSCNCGFLAQQITSLNKDQIHARAMERFGDWNEQLNDYCPTSGLRIDDIISDMIAFGFDTDDLKHLERLSDPNVLRSLPLDERNLRQNVKHDVVKYLNAWASLIEEELLRNIQLPDFKKSFPLERKIH